MNEEKKSIDEMAVGSLEGDEATTEALKTDAEVQAKKEAGTAQKGKLKRSFFSRFTSLNLYSLVFLVILIGVVIMLFVLTKSNQKTEDDAQFSGQELTSEALSKLKNSDATVGDSKQTLTIAANTIINGKTLIKNDLDVAGTLRIGSPLTLPESQWQAVVVSKVSTSHAT